MLIAQELSKTKPSQQERDATLLRTCHTTPAAEGCNNTTKPPISAMRRIPGTWSFATFPPLGSGVVLNVTSCRISGSDEQAS